MTQSQKKKRLKINTQNKTQVINEFYNQLSRTGA